MVTKKDKRNEKICNVCGEDCYSYSVYRNAIICKNCEPPQWAKKVASESTMLNKILEGEKK